MMMPTFVLRFVYALIGVIIIRKLPIYSRCPSAAPQPSPSDESLQQDIPTVYVVTPTYSDVRRLVQKAELTRLSQTLRLVRRLHWVVVEDSHSPTTLVSTLLKRSGLNYTQLNVMSPPGYRSNRALARRGVNQRNLGLRWIRGHVKVDEDGDAPGAVVYFADDDNTYDVQLFEEMRTTETVAVWPVGLVGGLLYDGPICKGNKVTGFRTVWAPDRRFPMDIAGFAINARLFLDNPSVEFEQTGEAGYLESDLLSRLITSTEQLQPRADLCTKVYVWHTRTERPTLEHEAKKKISEQRMPGDLIVEV